MWHIVYLVQALFLAGSIIVQVKVLLSFPQQLHDKMGGDLKSIMGVPVSRFHIKVLWYNVALLTPMFLHTVSSAVAIGEGQAVWESNLAMQASFLERWSDVPLLGGLVGHAGLPGTLTVILGLSFVFHGCALVGNQLGLVPEDAEVANSCEASNLLLMYKLFANRYAFGGVGEIPVIRLAIFPLIKMPMVWGKISLLSLTYDSLSFSGKASMVIAIFLGWYSFLPIFEAMRMMMKLDRALGSIPLVIVSLGFVIMISHFVGIFLCSESHDFSLMHLGCTEGITGSNLTAQNVSLFF